MAETTSTLSEAGKEIADKMKSENCTNAWDMVCCYDETHINQLLEERYKAGDLVKEVTVPSCLELPGIGFYWTEVTLSLKEPLISFETDADVDCSLCMVIEKGSYVRYVKNAEGEIVGEITDPIEIPPNVLCIQASIPIAGVTGGVGNGMLRRLGNTNTVIEFGDDVKEASIILDFEHEKATYKIQDVAGGTEKAEEIFSELVLNDFKTVLQQYFADEIDSLKYKIGGLDTTKVTGVLMLPKSFVFAIGSAATTDRHSLNIYVQITDDLDEEKAKYKSEHGDISPSFQPGGEKILPFPEGCTACVILSHKLMEQLYFPMAVSDKNWSVVSGDGEEKTEGICIKLKLSTTVKFKGKPDDTSSKSYKIEEGVIDFSKDPLVLTLKDDNASVTWGYQSAEMKYHMTQMYFNIGGVTEYDGKIRVNGSCDKGGLVTKTIDQGETLKWEINIQSADFVMSGEVTEYTDDFLIHNKKVPQQFRAKCEEAAQEVMPSISLSLDALNTFVAGNILFPGKNVFTISADAGCYAPRDFIIFGNLKEKLDSEVN